MNNFQRGGFLANMPIIVKNLLIVNVLFFLGTLAVPSFTGIFGAFYFDSPRFEPWQIVTHMFMHGGFAHILFNMFALWMFGTAIERVWGPKRFLIYYFVCGLGAYFLYTAVLAWQINDLVSQLGPEAIEMVKTQGIQYWLSGQNYTNPELAQLNAFYNIPVLGASGAIFGLLLAFGMMFPDLKLMMLFFPVPIKAKYFVIGYGAIELISGISNRPGDNTAHFAHLGGMLFGFILIKYWGKNPTNYRQF